MDRNTLKLELAKAYTQAKFVEALRNQEIKVVQKKEVEEEQYFLNLFLRTLVDFDNILDTAQFDDIDRFLQD